MRCSCCDRILNDFEATRKFKESGEYADVCNKCASTMEGVKFTIRTDLDPTQVNDEDLFDVEAYNEIDED